MVRFLPSLPGYIYAQKKDNIYVNLFIAGTAHLQVNNTNIKIVQENNYPWDGLLSFTVDPDSKTSFALRIRIPGWVRSAAIPSDLYSFNNKSSTPFTINLNGIPINYELENGYAVIQRTWAKGDKIQMNLPIEVKKVVANKSLMEDQNKVALQRGPIIYCAEWKDNDGSVSNIMIPENSIFKAQYQENLLNGVTVLKTEVIRKDSLDKGVKKSILTSIPYYSWANRGKGEMRVWFPIDKFTKGFVTKQQ